MDVLIRDLPDEVHAELVLRAAEKDMSLRAYVRGVLSDHVAIPSMSGMADPGGGPRDGAHRRWHRIRARGRGARGGRRAARSLSVAVVGAGTVVDLICGFPAARPFRGPLTRAGAVAAPAHLDAEALSALARLRRAGRLSRGQERVEASAT